MTGCTLLLYLSDLLHSFLQNCTFVRLDIKVVNVIEVGEDQLGEFFDVFVLVLAVALFVAPLWTAETKRVLGKEKWGRQKQTLEKEVQVWGGWMQDTVYHRINGQKRTGAERYRSYLGPKSSAEHSLRFRDSALAGSDEFSPTPLILNAYQRLETKQTHGSLWNMNAGNKCTNIIRLCRPIQPSAK